MKPTIHVTDHAVLRYLERAHGLDVDVIKAHIAGRVATGARLGAVGVTIENVKLVLRRNTDDRAVVSVTTALKPAWPALNSPSGQEL